MIAEYLYDEKYIDVIPGELLRILKELIDPKAICHDHKMTVAEILKKTRKKDLEIPALLVIDHTEKKYTIFYRDEKSGKNVRFGNFSHNLPEDGANPTPSPAPLKKPSTSKVAPKRLKSVSNKMPI